MAQADKSHGFEQLPPDLRADDWKRILARPSWERPRRVCFGISVPRDVVMEWGAKKGFCKPLKEPTNEAEEDMMYDRARNQMLRTRRNLLKLVKDSGHFQEAELDIPTYDGYSDVITFYSNYTRPKHRPSEDQERAATALLCRELGLSDDDTRPRWYFVFGAPDLDNY